MPQVRPPSSSDDNNTYQEELSKVQIQGATAPALLLRTITSILSNSERRIQKLEDRGDRTKSLSDIENLKMRVSSLEMLNNKAAGSLEEVYNLVFILSNKVDVLRTAFTNHGIKLDIDAVAQNAAVTGSQLDITYQSSIEADTF